MRIVNLASGSKANSTFVCYNNTKLLVDAGLSEKKLKERLSEIGESIENISAVIVTHEHIDHIAGIKVLAKKYNLDFYIETKLVESNLIDAVFKPEKLHKIDLEKFSVGELEILPFSVSHDAVFPVGFVINAMGSKSKIAFLTDVGEVDENVKRAVAGSKIIFIESNYDEGMLLGGFYPEKVKRRIYGKFGHLSNSQSLELAKELFKSGTKCFVISHISENNNTYETAYLNYVNYFESLGLSLDSDVFIRLSYQGKHGNNLCLKEEFDG